MYYVHLLNTNELRVKKTKLNGPKISYRKYIEPVTMFVTSG